MNATRPIASQTDAATVARLQAQRQEMNANDSGKLAPQDVASWLTLQRLTLTQRGVCSEPEMFYRTEGNVLVSETIGRVMLDPGATIKFNTAFNLLGLEALQSACRIGRLALGLQGSGQVEVRVYQGLSGRSWERLVCDIVQLDPEVETLFDLSASSASIMEGALWVELRACDATEALRLDGGRFLTESQPDAGMRLAICRPGRISIGAAGDHDSAEADRLLPVLLDWAQDKTDRIGLFSTPEAGTVAADRLDQRSTYVALLTQARAQGYSHAVLVDPDCALAPETLERTFAYLSILRDPMVALGAGVLDVSEAWLLGDNGLVRNAAGKPTPLFNGTDMRNIANVLDIGFNTVAGTEAGLILAQSTFVALSIAALGADIAAALVQDRFGVDALTLVQANLVVVHQMPGLMLRRDTFGRKVGGLVTLQNLIFPEQGICTEADLFFHVAGPAAYEERGRTITIDQGATVFFDTYFNGLSIGKWHEGCTLDGLFLAISGRGKVEVKVFHAIPDRSWEMLLSEVVTLTKVRETLLDLSHYAENSTRGMIYFEVRAVGAGVQVSGARYLTPGQINQGCKLALSITTFKREDQVENTARRLVRYFEGAEYGDQMHCFIIDNGKSASIPSHPKITHLPNANLGGAGGFTRGLLEGQAAGYSHVLFMDDDASIPMEALHRTYAYLTLARNPKAAVAGAMINNTDKWRMWENGAVFDRKCKPLFTGTDLRSREAVFAMEFESARSKSSKTYGGWWFFAFPVAEVKRHPFPFFVRGDDVNFSLVNEFAITTLNGVVSFADDFIDKESPLTWYLDLRSHMVHHLTLDKMEVGRFQVAKIGISFFLRNMVKFQYETIEAILLAWGHVLQGPDFFVKNADAAGPRAAIKALTRAESWTPVGDLDLVVKPGFLGRWPSVRRKVYPWSLNGYFLPLYRFWGGKRVIPAGQRGHLDAMWGAYQLTFLKSNRDKGYVTRRSNWKGFALTLRMIWLWLRLVLGYGSLRALYHRRYPEITTPGYWQGALNIPAPQAVAAE